MTEVVLAVTVAKDVVVISLFTMALALALVASRPDAVVGLAFFGTLVWEVGGSIGAGLVLGWLVIKYLDRLGHELPLLVLGVAFAASTVLPEWHLSGLLACMVAGFTIENGSAYGERLIQAIERHSLPVYVVFFTIAGASLDLNSLAATWRLALLLAGLRLLLTAFGTSLGAHLAGASRSVVAYGWSGFGGQAGVTLGMAILIEARFPELGGPMKALVLGTVAINQLVGPVLFRVGLERADEVATSATPDHAPGRA